MMLSFSAASPEYLRTCEAGVENSLNFCWSSKIARSTRNSPLRPFDPEGNVSARCTLSLGWQTLSRMATSIGAAAAAGTPTQTLNRGAGQQTQISWQADDPDGDRLVYSVYFRGEEEREWKLLRSNLFENTLNLDAEVLADGRYYFRVVASDRPSNPQPQARDNDLISAPVLIDNTPPVIRVTNSRRAESNLELTVEAADQTSTLRRCEYSLDAGPWFPVEAADGVTDSATETFRIQIDNLRPGEHLVVVRVYDAAGNAGLAKVVTR